MNITHDGNTIEVTGDIKSLQDYTEVKETISKMIFAGSKSIQLNITNSASITSSVIGFLIKLINIDKIDLKVATGNSKLYKMLNDLNLTDLFKVTNL